MSNLSIQESILLAKEKINNSYSPYSNFKVCAVVKAVGYEQLFYGVNVENASFGGTICAERSAITNMISTIGGNIEIEFILIMTKDQSSACLICQQFMTEFSGGKQIPLFLSDLNGNYSQVLSNIGFYLK